MSTHPAKPNGTESKLVFIVTQGRMEPVLKEFLAKGGGGGLEYATWHSDTVRPTDTYRTAIEQSEGDLLSHVRALVAGKGIPAAELASAMPNLMLVISTDPSFRDTSQVNGGTNLRFVDTQSPSLVCYDRLAQEMLDYIANGNSTGTTPEH